MNRQGLLLVGAIVGVFIVYEAIVSVIHPSGGTILTTEVAPRDSTISINGHRARFGNNRVAPGTYTVAFQHAGFTANQKKVAVTKGQTLYVGDILTPSDPKLKDWYVTHPSDSKLAESISSKGFDAVSSQQQTANPLLKYLPFVSGSFEIDSGASQKYPNDPTKTAVYISYTYETDKQRALDWIKAKGVDPNGLEIIYQQQIPDVVR